MTKLTGKNHTWEPYSSQWQRDNAAAPFAADEVGEVWWQSLLLWVSVIAAPVSLVMLCKALGA